MDRFMLGNSLSKISPQLTISRLKGYKWVLTGQLIVMSLFLFAYELFERYPFMYWQDKLLAAMVFV